MHGYNHVYDMETKKDYFSYGGRSEFFGHPVEIQKNKLMEGLKIFKKMKLILIYFLLQIILMI